MAFLRGLHGNCFHCHQHLWGPASLTCVSAAPLLTQQLAAVVPLYLDALCPRYCLSLRQMSSWWPWLALAALLPCAASSSGEVTGEARSLPPVPLRTEVPVDAGYGLSLCSVCLPAPLPRFPQLSLEVSKERRCGGPRQERSPASTGLSE